MRFEAFSVLSAAVLWTLSSTISAETLPKNVEMANDAWSALEAGEFRAAIERADLCVVTFESQADEIQNSLHEQNVPVPKPHLLSTESARAEVFARGPLNDVAACLFIKIAAGIAAGAEEDTICTAYSHLIKLPHALVWDPRGWFWSPSDASTSEIKKVGLDSADCAS